MMSFGLQEKALEEARQWIGTPYRHQGAEKGIGTDCLGLIRGIYRELYGREPELPPAYTPDWAEAKGKETLLEAAKRHLQEIEVDTARPGDVLLFRMNPHSPCKHAAILSGETTIIHAYWGRAVTETHLVPWWRRRIAAGFRF